MPARTLATSPSSKTSSPQSAKRCAAQPQGQAVLYARVSSKDQEKEGFSIPAQQRLLREYALEKGLAIPQEFIDVETAKHNRRPWWWRRGPRGARNRRGAWTGSCMSSRWSPAARIG